MLIWIAEYYAGVEDSKAGDSHKINMAQAGGEAMNPENQGLGTQGTFMRLPD